MTDLELAQGVLAGSESMEELFYKRYQGRLYKAAVYFLGPRDPDAEDVVQQAFLIAFKKLDTYDPSRASLYTWMARICVNLCYQRLDKRRREQASAWEELEAASQPLARKREAESAEASRKDSLLAVLRAGIARLGDACRKIIELRDLQGLSYADVGKKLKMPIGTVMSKLSRCRQSLKVLVTEMEA